MKKKNTPTKNTRFLEGCVDECAINGNMIVDEHIFDYSKSKWDPRITK